MYARLLIAVAVSIAASLTGWCFAAAQNAGTTAAGQLPRVFVWDPAVLHANKLELVAGSERLQPAYEALIRQAEAALKVEPVSVMEKEQVPPSGDRHDYMSIATYAWPNPATESGLPYVHRDGERSPAVDSIPDKANKNTMISTVETLALAYYFSGDERYARHAAVVLRTWFLDPATRMNPNLNYTQVWPGLGPGTGRPYGILDCAHFSVVVGCVGLLDGSEHWSAADQQGIEAWFSEYLDWLLTSNLGKPLADSTNNHGSWYDVQVVSYALFLGKPELAREFCELVRTRRIEKYIEPDGSQPTELRRTKSWDYSLYNLRALLRLAELGDRVGVDLWNHEAADGRSLRTALEFLLPHAQDHSGWQYKQIKDYSNGSLIELLHQGAAAWDCREYVALAAELSGGGNPAHRRNLLLPAAAFE